jgi:hypothetical protein
MASVFLLQHVHEFDDGHEDINFIGVYSSEALARDAQQQIAAQPGFRDLPEGFCISEHEIDSRIGWPEGYVTIQPGEE